MSTCTSAVCPHAKDVFVWLADGPWLGDPSDPADLADPDRGNYPFVHAAPVGPAHLEVCRLMPFATPAECGEACEDCGCASGRHEWPTGPIVYGEVRSPGRCLDCRCQRMRYAPVALRGPGGTEDNLMRGRSVPGASGACSREGCAHSLLHHTAGRAARVGRCRQCRCPGWTDEAGAAMPPEPDTQLALFGGAA